MITQNMRRLLMELTKEEMKLVITWLEMHYYTISNYYIDDVWSPDIEKLPKVVTKFQNYLNKGEPK